jgi:hypothetical protein
MRHGDTACRHIDSAQSVTWRSGTMDNEKRELTMDELNAASGGVGVHIDHAANEITSTTNQRLGSSNMGMAGFGLGTAGSS